MRLYLVCQSSVLCCCALTSGLGCQAVQRQGTFPFISVFVLVQKLENGLCVFEDRNWSVNLKSELPGSAPSLRQKALKPFLTHHWLSLPALIAVGTDVNQPPHPAPPKANSCYVNIISSLSRGTAATFFLLVLLDSIYSSFSFVAGTSLLLTSKCAHKQTSSCHTTSGLWQYTCL